MIAALDQPFLSALVGDDETAELLGVRAEIAAMLSFESALAQAEAGMGVIPAAAAARIAEVLSGFLPDIDGLRAGAGRDGVVVAELVRQIRVAVGEPHAKHVHFGATSQDVIDTALVMRALSCLDIIERRLAVVTGALADVSRRFGERSLMAHTRMQPAIPIRVADRIESWRAPLIRHVERLEVLRQSLGVVQLGGAAGTLDAFGGKGPALRSALASRLGLRDAPQWQSQRDRIAELAGWLSLVTGSLGKIGQDIAILADAGGEIALVGGGSSSAMAHKQNPVDAELLVTLARFNAVQVSGIHQALVHEQERSGAGWTLEWMILPQMLVAAGAATRLAAGLIDRVDAIGC